MSEWIGGGSYIFIDGGSADSARRFDRARGKVPVAFSIIAGRRSRDGVDDG
jgi:hypothetical protein